MSTQAARASRRRLASLLGHPELLAPAEVARRRTVLAGCPESLTRATHGSLVDILGESFALNLSELVVDELVAALNVEAVSSADDRASAAVWDCWQRSELGAASEGMWSAAAADGQAFLVVDGGPDGPTAWVNVAYDGEQGLELRSVDADGTVRVALKHELETLVRDRRTGLLVRLADWLAGLVGMPRERAAVEYVTRRIRTEYVYDRAADVTRIRHFVADPGRPERQARWVDGEWVDAEADEVEVWPWGCPIIPVVAPGGGELAELEDPQRLVNAAALDLAAAARVDSLRIVYTIDCAPLGGGVSGTSRTEPVYLTPGVCIELVSRQEERSGSVGQIQPSDLGALMEALKLRVETMLMLGRTSTFVLPWKASGTVYPSGAALQIANRPFGDKVSRYQERWGTALERLFRTWLRMLALPAAEVSLEWRSVRYTTRTEDLQDALLMQQLGVPLSQQAAALGYSPEQRMEWEDELGRVRGARLAAVAAQSS